MAPERVQPSRQLPRLSPEDQPPHKKHIPSGATTSSPAIRRPRCSRATPPKSATFCPPRPFLNACRPPLCDALRERDDSAALLDRVRRAGLFLNGLDARGEWFRYHDLFREFLMGRLSPAIRLELNHRAGEWFARQGDPTLAIRHTAAAEDTEMASGLVRGHVGSALSGGLCTVAGMAAPTGRGDNPAASRSGGLQGVAAPYAGPHGRGGTLYGSGRAGRRGTPPPAQF